MRNAAFCALYSVASANLAAKMHAKAKHCAVARSQLSASAAPAMRDLDPSQWILPIAYLRWDQQK
jgi:hypothetical protein